MNRVAIAQELVRVAKLLAANKSVDHRYDLTVSWLVAEGDGDWEPEYSDIQGWAKAIESDIENHVGRSRGVSVRIS